MKRYRIYTLKFLPLMLLTGLSGCGWLVGDEGLFKDRGQDYQQAEQSPSLRIPSNLDELRIQDAYPIPAIDDDTSVVSGADVPRPEPLLSSGQDQFVKLQKLLNDEWILVDASPAKIWTQLRGYLSARKIPVSRVETELGLIESDWFVQEAEANQQRFRYSLVQGVQRDTAEITVLHWAKGDNIQTWPQRSSDAEAARVELKNLAQYIADIGSFGAVSMMAQKDIDSKGRVFLQLGEDNYPYMRLQLGFARAWASLYSAVGKAGMDITDSNRESSQIFVSFLPELKKKPGFFKRLFSQKKPVASEYLLSVVDSSGGDVAKDRGAGKNVGVRIAVTNVDGDRIEKQEAEKVLKMIKRHIS